jgi:radical SAM superfamily enzyme
MQGTKLEEMYQKKLYTPPTLSEYAEAASECIGNISEQMIIHRITGDCPKNLLIAPEWNKNKNEIIGAITSYMENKKIKQGSLI